jgi:CHAD domain-containing protein
VSSRPDAIDADSTARQVLQQVLSRSAWSLLLNDTPHSEDASAPVDALDGAVHLGTSPLTPTLGARRRLSEEERIHQSRVALRRIRSNLRTFRLLFDPAWCTSLRAELAWYTDRLGESRDLHVLRDEIAVNGPLTIDETELVPLLEIIAAAIADADIQVSDVRAGPRRAQLQQTILDLTDTPPFTDKASLPAGHLLTSLLHRTWRDVRGSSRNAKADPSGANLHTLRIRVKDLRYGSETAAMVVGIPARRAAKASERLQTRLGNVHDAHDSIDRLRHLAVRHPEIAEVTERLVTVQHAALVVDRKGWRNDLKEVERRWRNWNR